MKNLSKRLSWSLCILLSLLSLAGSAFSREPIPLRAGPVTALFDADNVFLRYVRVGPHEVLRGVNAPIRNENWATIAPTVSKLKVKNRRSTSVLGCPTRTLTTASWKCQLGSQPAAR